MRVICAGGELRNDTIKSVIDIAFRPLDTSIRDCVESLLSVAGVQPQLKDGYSMPADLTKEG